jgi:3-methyladenine DNA glycosylase AlkD
MRRGNSLAAEAEDVRRQLRDLADPRAAALARRALRSPWRFHGVVPPAVRAVARQAARRHRGDRDLAGLLEVARRLWASRWHEEKTAAIQMIAAFARHLENAHWNEFKAWLRGVRTADHCDSLATAILGSLVKRDRSWCRVLKHWTLSRSVWERRAAVGAVFLRVRHMGDVEAGFGICEPLMRDRSPEVREAVASLLREALAANAPATRSFLQRWRGRADPELRRCLPAE